MPRLGIIAGGGALPARLAETCRVQGRDFFILGFKGQTDEGALRGLPHAFSKLGTTGASIRILKENGVDTLVMAGAIRRPSLADLKPDWRTIQFFARLGARAFGDDALLRAVVEEVEKDGFKIIGAHEVDPGLLTPVGILGKIKPTPEQQADLDTGIRMARELGRLDIGQAVVVQQGMALGVEAAEGTDALIDRCKIVKRRGRGGVLVKSCKPQQDKRLDLPTVGLRTVRKCFEAGIEGIAVEAGASLILDRDGVIDAADRLGLFVVGFGV
jgi:DUF1009 family protein